MEKIVRDVGLQETLDALQSVCEKIAGELRDSAEDEDDDTLADEWDDAADQIKDLEVGDL